MAWGSRSTSPYPWSFSIPVSKLSSKRSAPPGFSWPSMKAHPAPASKCATINHVWCVVSETTARLWFDFWTLPLSYKPFSLNLWFEVPNGSAARARWGTIHPPPSPQTANQPWATSLPPHPLHQPPPRSAGATLTWTASRTNRSHSDAPRGTHLEVTGQLKEAVEVICCVFLLWRECTVLLLYALSVLWLSQQAINTLLYQSGGGSATASPQLKRRLIDPSAQPKFFLNLDRSKLTLIKK